MKYTGKILVLAYPDTFVKMSDEFICKVLPLVGLGTRTHIKAGHAALVLIENKTGIARYYDYGRYVTPTGYGRVRGANTDAELKIPFKAKIVDGTLENLDEFLKWLDAHPEKTHGSGRLVASVCNAIDYKKAQAYIDELQEKGSIPYKAFGKLGQDCNCSRFVTDAILAATDDVQLKKGLQWNKKFTPSTVGNVEKSASEVGIFEVYQGVIKPYNSTAFKENITNYFDHKIPEHIKYPEQAVLNKLPEHAQLLDGIGSRAWFSYDGVHPKGIIISRYNEKQEKDFQGVFTIPKELKPDAHFTFDYDCNCAFCHVVQDGKRYRIELVKEVQGDDETSSSQMAHSA